MNKHQKMVVKLAKINMKIHNINYSKARKMANNEILSIRNMLINKYGFKRK